MGLGLYIVRVIAHGGTIGVTSTEQDWTSFTVKLTASPP
jgi:signal transduction histidine kinase